MCFQSTMLDLNVQCHFTDALHGMSSLTQTSWSFHNTILHPTRAACNIASQKKKNNRQCRKVCASSAIDPICTRHQKILIQSTMNHVNSLDSMQPGNPKNPKIHFQKALQGLSSMMRIKLGTDKMCSQSTLLYLHSRESMFDGKRFTEDLDRDIHRAYHIQFAKEMWSQTHSHATAAKSVIPKWQRHEGQCWKQNFKAIINRN